MSATLRLDKWLWFARFVKSRADAQKLIERGQVTLNGQVVQKTSAAVRPGDALVIVIASSRHAVSIAALGTRRGPAPEAQALYVRTMPPERLGFEEAALPLRIRGRST
jgi:ribosome-associated heat shock protein Hsp15